MFFQEDHRLCIERRQYANRWAQVQAEFVDNPKSSLSRADELLAEVMAARGYPVQDFEQRAGDLSVDHPVVVQHYHAAHAIALRDRAGQTTTEDLRQAMIHYQALFDELVSEAHRANAGGIALMLHAERGADRDWRCQPASASLHWRREAMVRLLQKYDCKAPLRRTSNLAQMKRSIVRPLRGHVSRD